MTTQTQARYLSIEHFVPPDWEQVKNLVAKYGDYELPRMAEVDQAALMLVMAAMVYRHYAKVDQENGAFVDIWDAAEQAIPDELDRTTDEFQVILEILDGISVQVAVGIMQFLLQEE